MSDPVDVLLTTLTRLGVKLTADLDNLRIDDPDGVLTDGLMDLLKWHKLDILDRLHRTKPCHNEHFLPKYWIDAPPRDGMIRTTCRLCGKFIGYRPVDGSKKRNSRDQATREDREATGNETQTDIDFEDMD